MMGKDPLSKGLIEPSLRCGAKTRSGRPCMSPRVTGKKRCRMHGGAAGSGAPKGNRNALKHGLYTREAMERNRQLQRFAQLSRRVLELIDPPE
jgi:hypothetical protein